MTTENNKIIAEFMGWEIKNYSTPISDIVTPYGQINENQLKFNSDWNWLIKVVDKIEETTITETYGEFNENKVDAKVSVSIENTFCQILSNGLYLNEIVSIDGETKIQAVYSACLEFIKWYNEQK